MKRIRLFFPLCVAAFLAAILAGCGGSSDVTIADNFQSYTAGYLASPWDWEFTALGDISVLNDPLTGSKAVYKSQGGFLYYHEGTSAENCTVKVMARWGGAINTAAYGLIARRTFSGVYYRLYLQPSSGTIGLIYRSGLADTTLGYVLLPTTFTFAEYHELKLVVNGTSISGYLDGALKLSATNSENTGAGCSGIALINGDAYFDNFACTLQ